MRKIVTLFVTALTTGLGAAVVCGLESPKAATSPNVNAAVARPVLMKLPDLRAGKVFLAKYVPPETLTQYEPINLPLVVGQKVYLVCPFTNDSDVPVSGSWKVGYYIDGKQVYFQNFGAIAAHHSQDPGGWWVVEGPGPHTYMCALDFENTIAESNERNNKASMPFQAIRLLPPPRPH